MRKIRIIEHTSLDGIIQAPGGRKEDGDYPYGGWSVPHTDPISEEAIAVVHSGDFALLLGRHTYDIWSGYWPKAGDNPFANSFNAATKYVVTHRPDSLAWGPVESVGVDVVAGLRRIKATDGPDLVCWGSSAVTQILIEHELTDEILLITYPVLLGAGKRFFPEGTPPRELKLVSSKAGSLGVVFHTYQPNGPLRTGDFDDPAT